MNQKLLSPQLLTEIIHLGEFGGEVLVDTKLFPQEPPGLWCLKYQISHSGHCCRKVGGRILVFELLGGGENLLPSSCLL